MADGGGARIEGHAGSRRLGTLRSMDLAAGVFWGFYYGHDTTAAMRN